MQLQSLSSFRRLNRIAPWLVVLSLAFGSISIIETASSQEKQKDATVLVEGQKKLFMVVPAKLPLKVQVKNLKKGTWVHDLELEVTNTSNRPIYFLDFYVTLPEIKGTSGHTVGFWMKYGRGELLNFSTPLKKDDVPILPGEKHIFKISESSAKGWDRMKEKEGKPEPAKIVIEFQGLNFGDGTGYSDTGATPVDIHKNQSGKTVA